MEIFQLTKDEFLEVWESENGPKLHMQAEEQTSQMISCKEKQNQSSNNPEPYNRHIFKEDWQKSNPELIHNLSSYSDHPYRLLLEKQEQISQQLNFMYDHILQELGTHCEVISRNIKDVVESQTNSLKLYFIHEVELLKQDLRGFILEQKGNSEASIKNPETSSEKKRLDKCEGPASIQSVTYTTSEISDSHNISIFDQENGSEQQSMKLKDCSFQEVQKEFHLYQSNLGEPDLDFSTVIKTTSIDCMAHNNDLRNNMEGEHLFSESIHSTPLKSYADVVSSSLNAEKSPLYYAHMSKKLSDQFSVTASQKKYLKGDSVAATGLFAQVICDQMKKRKRSRAKSAKSYMSSDNPKLISNKPMLHSNILNTLPSDNFKLYNFKIINNSLLNVSTQPFFSPYIYSKGKACKARVSLGTERSGQLIVIVCLSKSVQDDYHKWPLFMNGSGYVYNSGSKRKTPLWQLEPTPSQKPESYEEELMFPANVCLKTSRRNYNNITYEQLTKRYTTADGALLMSWELQANEKMPDT